MSYIRSSRNAQFDNVGMSQQLQVLDLALDAADHVPRQELPARDGLQGDLAAAGLVNGQPDLPEGAFTEVLDDLILVEALHVPGRRRGLDRRIAAPAVGAWRRRHRHGGQVGVGESPAGSLAVSVTVTITIAVEGGEGEGEIFVVEGSGHLGRTGR